jgi:hypothetical protein
MYTQTIKKLKTLPISQSLQLQYNMGKIDYRNGKISEYDLVEMEYKLLSTLNK